MYVAVFTILRSSLLQVIIESTNCLLCIVVYQILPTDHINARQCGAITGSVKINNVSWKPHVIFSLFRIE
jgi:hypothetical protein